MTRYGLPQAIIYPGILLVIIIILSIIFLPAIWVWPILGILFIVFVWSLSFFRNPRRKIKYDENVLYSPCDGTVTSIETDSETIKISMFLSLFNVHINRAPCSCTVLDVRYKEGKFLDARHPDSAKENESNDLFIRRTAEPVEDIAVRQVSGAVARHIVCRTKAGDTLKQGERFGMIKFGSRTELIVSGDAGKEICVELGDKVKAGLNPLIMYTGVSSFVAEESAEA